MRWSGVHSFYFEGVDLTVFAVSSETVVVVVVVVLVVIVYLVKTSNDG